MSLAAAALRKARESAEVKTQFFAEHADRIGECCRTMAAAFDGGARLFAFGNGGSACDAQHAAVEFMHPIIGKRRAFPAIALPADAPLLTAIGNDEDFSMTFARQLRLLARKGDVALAISTSGKSSNVNRALETAREVGMLTVGMTGKDGGRMTDLCDHCFTVPSFSLHRIQETHETLLHVLWDLVHVARGEEDVL
jgi:D-sedoheptulose 7-phosphate isomerase